LTWDLLRISCLIAFGVVRKSAVEKFDDVYIAFGARYGLSRVSFAFFVAEEFLHEC
jgi:hypothetical protein